MRVWSGRKDGYQGHQHNKRQRYDEEMKHGCGCVHAYPTLLAETTRCTQNCTCHFPLTNVRGLHALAPSAEFAPIRAAQAVCLIITVKTIVTGSGKSSTQREGGHRQPSTVMTTRHFFIKSRCCAVNNKRVPEQQLCIVCTTHDTCDNDGLRGSYYSTAVIKKSC